MTPKQSSFVEEYMKDMNGKQAAIRAGYSPRSAEKQAAVLLQHVEVSEAVAEAVARRAERSAVKADDVLAELARIGFSDLRAVFDGSRLRSPAEWDARTAAAIQSVKVTTRSLGEGEVEHVAEIKLWDKVSALDKLARHLGLLNDKLTLKGDAENPLQVLVREIQGRALPVVQNPPEDLE